MKYYFYKLLPPRPTFPGDMTEAEKGVMMRHGAYWREHLQGGRAIAVGPVADPAGAYGVGIVALDDAADPKTLAEHDPAIMANLGFRAEIFPMPRLIARGVD